MREESAALAEADWPEVPKFIEAPRGFFKARATFTGAAVVFAVLVLLLTSYSARLTAISALEEEGLQRLEALATGLQGEIEKYEYLPVILSQNKDLVELLLNPENLRRIDRVNRDLETINRTAATSAVYLMDRTGLTLAASNWNTDRPFVGRNFRFRPYFQTALQGDTGRYFALGTTSGKRGYYLAHPVALREDEILGVIVVKIGIDNLEAAWTASGADMLVTDENGIVAMSTRPEWLYRSLDPIPTPRLRQIRQSRQYANAPLAPLPIAGRRFAGSESSLLALDDGTDDRTYLEQSVAFPQTGWRLHLLTGAAAIDRWIQDALVVAGTALALVAFFAYLMFQRRLRLWERMHYQRKARQALQQAHDQLEQRVAQRTRDLRQEVQERRRTEETLRATQSEMIHAGKMAALGQMSAGITHELNQPLTAIRSFADNAQILLDRDRLDDVRENLRQIGTLTDRMATITGDLKTFARKSPDTVGSADPTTTIKGALSLFTRIARARGLQIHDDLGDDLPPVIGEEVRLEQVFLNLFRNALDAMEAQSAAVPRRLWVTAETTPETVSVSVRDSGPGLSPENLHKAFDPFYTTKTAGKGLGLGLSISERIVNDFGGTLSAANHPGGGAVFTVGLRRAEADRRPMAASA